MGRKKNVFMYGCEQRESRSSEARLSERILPRLLWENALVFAFEDCSFAMQKSKDTTARVVVAKELGIANSYTMEASFCGANFGRYNSCHFSTMHFEQVGRSFCETIFDFCDPNQTRAHAALQELQMLYPADKQDDGDADSDWDEESGTRRTKKKKPRDKEKEKPQKKPAKGVTRRGAAVASKKSDGLQMADRPSRSKDDAPDAKRRGPSSSREKADK